MADTPDSFARKRRILAHLAQSRRARQSSRFDDKSAAAQARLQRRLEAQRQQAADKTEDFSASVTGANQKAEPANADSRNGSPEAAESGESTSAQRPDSPALRRLHDWFASPNPQPTITRQISGRIQNPPAASTGPEQGEIARLQAKAQAETQRAELVIALLEDVLSTSTARIVKQQARLEAMQAQINSLHGR